MVERANGLGAFEVFLVRELCDSRLDYLVVSVLEL